ncbi:hypothetical protein [Kangiella taiwanensis]|uniref:hypothetical protein n=1 Tax=Kangiella taiwanensis TaxID=1079179 RepID=UPI001CBC6CCA|nr:hypothetical protein [Kangiella taiwanensis]
MLVIPEKSGISAYFACHAGLLLLTFEQSLSLRGTKGTSFGRSPWNPATLIPCSSTISPFSELLFLRGQEK